MCKVHGTLCPTKVSFDFPTDRESRGSVTETRRMQTAFDGLVAHVRNSGQWPTCENGKPVQADIVQDEHLRCLHIEFVCCFPVCPQIQWLMDVHAVASNNDTRDQIHERAATFLSAMLRRVIPNTAIVVHDDQTDDGLPLFVVEHNGHPRFHLWPTQDSKTHWKLARLMQDGDRGSDADVIGEPENMHHILQSLAGALAKDLMVEETCASLMDLDYRDELQAEMAQAEAEHKAEHSEDH